MLLSWTASWGMPKSCAATVVAGPGAAWAEGAGAAAFPASISDLTMRLLGPEPFMEERSSPFCSANRRASGLALTLSPASASDLEGADSCRGAGAGSLYLAGAFSVLGVALGSGADRKR